MLQNLVTALATADAAFWMSAGAIVLLLTMSAFFSGTETAMTAASRAKLKSQADRGSRSAGRALRITADSERLIGAMLLGNNLVNILAAALATSLFTRLFGDGGVAVATLVMTLLVLIFAEVLPKTYAITQPETAARRVAPVVGMIIPVLAPFVRAVQWLVRGILRIAGVDAPTGTALVAVQEEIAGAITLGHSAGAVGKDHRDRLLGALDLHERTVEEVMLHRSRIEMIDVAAPADEVIARCLDSAHTRLPVFDGDPENIVGVIHAKQLLKAIDALRRDEADLEGFNLLDVTMTPYFIPETTPLDDQMREFLRRRAHFALVVDEYGALQGLITLEDILEEIVGQIHDEHDPEHPTGPVERQSDGSYVVDGLISIRDLNRATDWNLPDAEANTVAGLVIHEAQTIPEVGQVFSFLGFRFEVLERARNRLTRLRIRKL